MDGASKERRVKGLDDIDISLACEADITRFEQTHKTSFVLTNHLQSDIFCAVKSNFLSFKFFGLEPRMVSFIDILAEYLKGMTEATVILNSTGR